MPQDLVSSASRATLPVTATRTISRTPGAIVPRPKGRHGLDLAGATLHVDTHAIPLGAIASYQASGFSEKDLSSAFATIAVFSGVGCILIFGVVEIGWRANFLLGGTLFGAIAICAVAELFAARRQTLYTFTVETRDGIKATYVTADRDDAERVKAALDGALAVSK